MTKETAMKILKELHDKSLYSERTALETIVPELKESEDERIRKDLLAFIKAPYVYDFIVHDRVDPWISWLEKQGEQKPVDINTSLINKMVNDYENTDEYIEGDYKGKPVNCMVRAYRQGIKDILSISKGNHIKHTWSENDENMANDIIEGCLSSEKAYYIAHTSEEIADWLKSIKDRVKGKEE